MVEGAVANEEISEGLCLREKIAEIIQKNIMELNKIIKKRNEGFKSKIYHVGDTVLKKKRQIPPKKRGEDRFQISGTLHHFKFGRQSCPN